LLTEQEIFRVLKLHGYKKKRNRYDTDENVPRKIIQIVVVDDRDMEKELVLQEFSEKKGV